MSWIPGELPADGASISGLASWLPPGCAITLRTLASTACACMCGVIALCARCSGTDEGVTAHGREDPPEFGLGGQAEDAFGDRR